MYTQPPTTSQQTKLRDVGVERKKAKEVQAKTWNQSMKSLIAGLSRVGRCRLPSRSPRDCFIQRLATVGGVAQKWSLTV